MTNDEIMQMTKEANLVDFGNGEYAPENAYFLAIKRFAILVAKKEREACAKVCEELVPDMSRTANDASIWDVATFDCAEAIRARKP